MLIHREGHRILIFLILIECVLLYLIQAYAPITLGTFLMIAISFFVFFLLILQFFRNPKVHTSIDPKKIIAPADGKVVVIEKTEETEYLKDRRIQISIFMSPLNVHVNRFPVSGIVKYFKYHPGLFLVAWHPKASTDNERTTVVVETASGIPVLFRQVAGALAKRIKWYIKEGDVAQQGSEFGFIKFGSRVDIYLPLDAVVKVDLNQVTVGGETVIAELA